MINMEGAGADRIRQTELGADVKFVKMCATGFGGRRVCFM